MGADCGGIAVTVVVVARNEQRNIGRCIGSIARQDYPNLQLILVDDGSTDDTVAIARAAYPSLRVICSPKRSISANRDIGWRAAATPFVAFLDADCEAPPHWIGSLVSAALITGAAAVGGGNRPPAGQSAHYTALALMLQTFVGSRDSVQGRVPTEGRFVEHLPGLNVLYRTEALRLVGGYDPLFARMGEDEDLSRRLTGIGLRLYAEPTANVVHWQRADLVSWARNMRAYGRGRTWLLRRHPNAISPLFLVPPIALALCPIYLMAMAVFSALVALRAGQARLGPRLLLLFGATHIAYAFGQLEGIFVRGDNPAAAVRRRRRLLWLTGADPSLSIDQLVDAAVDPEDDVYFAVEGKRGFDVRPMPRNPAALPAMLADMRSELAEGGPAPARVSALLRRLFVSNRFDYRNWGKLPDPMGQAA